ncbi:uncharacterized protein TOL2_C30840 [Desulfobacula toluolica Tol2]|uniref:DUF4410 domain-containing protein n=2 Tax=Desulfobacula toluolica TaxID=28223 RepID=K0NIK3_DESTT|nr:uncharacterized protein TOL2_C30840 [Desulfobacula toluolica Tol2]
MMCFQRALLETLAARYPIVIHEGGIMRRNKYREAIFFIFIAVVLVTGCSTKHIAQAPSGNLASISNNISEIHINGAGQGVDDRLLHDLEKYLKAKLIIAGFDIDDEKEGMTLAVDVKTFSPGNAAARLIIGFGAGRGSLIYTAKYISSDGKVFAEMEGQERFTGLEVGFNNEYGGATTLQGADKARNVLVQEAAKHIVELTASR